MGPRRTRRTINPNGKLPTLVDDDGFALWESAAIMQYLCTKTPNTLFPEGRDRYDVTRWQFWDMAHFNRWCGALQYERVLKPMFGGEPDEKVIAEAEKFFLQFARVLDGHMIGREWIVGNAMTLADISVASSLTYAAPAAFPLADFPNVRALNDRMAANAAFASTFPKFG